MYSTPTENDLALRLGYEITINTEKGSTFTKGARNVWAVRTGWQTADLLDGSYQNHMKYNILTKALKRSITY